MKCPYCHAEMEKGYVEQELRHPILWYSAKRVNHTLFSKRKQIKISSLWKGGAVVMHHCETCKKFIIDENEPEV